MNSATTLMTSHNTEGKAEFDEQIKYYEQGVFPKLHPHQRALFVPGTFGCTNTTGVMQKSLEEQAEQIVIKLKLFHQYYLDHADVCGGLNSWHMYGARNALRTVGFVEPSSVVRTRTLRTCDCAH
jgi:hypothetical protein